MQVAIKLDCCSIDNQIAYYNLMENPPKKLSENLEDYLETIASLSAENGSARLTDIANAMSVKKPSVNAALYVLAERGLIIYEKYKPVVLTKDGEILAENVRRKHQLLSDFLIGTLGVNQSEADVAACKMEHALEDSIMSKLVKFLKGFGGKMCSSCDYKNEHCSKKCPYAIELSKLSVGDFAVILSCSDKNNLKILKNAGLDIGITFELSQKTDIGGFLTLKAKNQEITLSSVVAKSVKVKRI